MSRPAPGAGAGAAGPAPSVRRHAGAAADVAAVLGTLLVLGVVCGVVWWVLVDPAVFTAGRRGGSMGEAELAKRFDGDGWYAVVAAVAGFAAGVVLTWWRQRDLRLTTLTLVLGAGLAAAAMALTGRLLGPGDPDVALAGARPGEKVPVELLVTAPASYLVWPVAVLLGALIILWSPPKDESAGARRHHDAFGHVGEDRPESGPAR